MAPSKPDTALLRTLEQRVQRMMNDDELWPDQGPIVIGTSGGADSTALAIILAAIARRRGIPIYLAYFNHGLRAPEAIEAEETFVQQLGEILGADACGASGDVKRFAEHTKTSIEEAARVARYQYLARVAQESGASRVAVGHTATDQAETVLMHIIRGSQLNGLAGMASKSAWPFPGNPQLTLIRPLLGVRREDTLAFCRAAGIKPVYDESNDSLDYERNRIRHELVPLLRTFNPNVEEHLTNLARAAREEFRDEDEVAHDLVIPVPGGSIVPLDEFAAVKVASRGNVAFHAIHVAAGGTRGFYRRNFEAVQRLLTEGKTGDSVDLPQGFRAQRTREAVAIVRVDNSKTPLPEHRLLLEPEQESLYGHLVLKAGVLPVRDAMQMVEVDAEAARGLWVRRRHNGDRLQPLGMDGQTKKLQDLFVDAHVDRVERDRIPIFETEQGILWVGGLRIAEWAKPQSGRATVWLSYREAS